MNKMLLAAAAIAAFASFACAAAPQDAAAAGARKVVNIVNFARALDPRHPKAQYADVVRKEVALARKYGFKNTILFQYDALIDDDVRKAALESDLGKTEFGLWFEMSKPLNEAAGLAWKPKHDPSWQWDWYINPGFLMAYTQQERKALVDAAFAKFKEYFGQYPKVAGSWLLDAWSMDYMAREYGVDGFCICREQDNTDAYGLRGGYSNGAYYPSKLNMLSAAVDMANAVKAPVFKMLAPDPIYNYGHPGLRYADFPYKNICPTIEPVYPTGTKPEIVDWYFRVYTAPAGLLNLSYMQVGQENSFNWKQIGPGLARQYERIDALAKAGEIEVETLGETARRFKADHPCNCPQTQIALEDWSGAKRNSIWFNCRFYRANLFFDGGRLYFRDIHKMCDGFREPFHDTVCTGWKAEYSTPPVIDEALFSDAKRGVRGVMEAEGEFVKLEVVPSAPDTLAVAAVRKDGSKVRIFFDERSLSVSGTPLHASWSAPFLDTVSYSKDQLSFKYKDFAYSIECDGEISKTKNGFDIRPRGNAIRFDLSIVR